MQDEQQNSRVLGFPDILKVSSYRLPRVSFASEFLLLLSESCFRVPLSLGFPHLKGRPEELFQEFAFSRVAIEHVQRYACL